MSETGIQDKSFEAKLFEKAGGALQEFVPTGRTHQHLCGIHYYANDNTRFLEAHHYCTHINEDMHQCVIYDSNKSDAKLIGIEYVISKKLFDTLDPEEKKYWHSHVYEVKSGTLFMPFKSTIPKAIADKAEHKEMTHLVNTYGKTWHLWQVDRGDTVPLGEPQLMMALTRDGQISDDCLRKLETNHRINIQEKRNAREDITHFEPDTIADAYSY
ncbi:unnamed protein product [Cunninghamella blakesleeana]